MRAFVTGASGFLGINLIEELIAKGWDVIALHRENSRVTRLKSLKVKLVEGDILDKNILEKAIPENCEAVFHVAADTNMWYQKNKKQRDVNVNGTRNIVEVSINKKIKRLIHTSSIATYGFTKTHITEESPSNALKARLNYFVTKYHAENEIKKGIQKGLEAVILNPSNIMGPYDYNNWSQVFMLIKKGKLPMVPSGEGSWCHVKEVAKAHISSYYKGKTGEKYLLACEDASYRDIMRKIGTVLNCKVPDRTLPIPILLFISYIPNILSFITKKEPDLTPEKIRVASYKLLCRSEKAIKELDYQPSTVDEMVKDCHKWMVNEGML